MYLFTHSMVPYSCLNICVNRGNSLIAENGCGMDKEFGEKMILLINAERYMCRRLSDTAMSVYKIKHKFMLWIII